MAIREARPTAIEIEFDTTFGKANDATVDVWEVQAARRALMNLKTLLNRAPMLELLKEQIEESDRAAKKILDASKGEFRECRVDVTVKGVILAEYMKGMAAHAATRDQSVNETSGRAELTSYETFWYAAHPEHYTKLPGIGGVETIGGRPMRMTGSMTKDLPGFIARTIDSAYRNQGAAQLTLLDGTVWAWAFHQFKDTGDGMQIILRVWWPTAAPESYFEDHTRHFAVEFRNFIVSVAL